MPSRSFLEVLVPESVCDPDRGALALTSCFVLWVPAHCLFANTRRCGPLSMPNSPQRRGRPESGEGNVHLKVVLPRARAFAVSGLSGGDEFAELSPV